MDFWRKPFFFFPEGDSNSAKRWQRDEKTTSGNQGRDRKKIRLQHRREATVKTGVTKGSATCSRRGRARPRRWRRSGGRSGVANEKSLGRGSWVLPLFRAVAEACVVFLPGEGGVCDFRLRPTELLKARPRTLRGPARGVPCRRPRRKASSQRTAEWSLLLTLEGKATLICFKNHH